VPKYLAIWRGKRDHKTHRRVFSAPSSRAAKRILHEHVWGRNQAKRLIHLERLPKEGPRRDR
jgi:hypothetical protein